MRILLDACLPRKLKLDLPGHSVQTVPEVGWAAIKNGELLRRAARSFDAFITVDRGLSHQQNLAGLDLIMITLVASSNRLAALRPAMPRVLGLLDVARSGDVLRVEV